MNRRAVVLAALVAGLLGILCYHGLPWATSDTSGGVEHFTYGRLAEARAIGSITPDGSGSGISSGLALGLQGFYFGAALLLVAFAGILVRARWPALGAALALVGACAPLVSLTLFLVGGTLFGKALYDLAQASSGFVEIRFGVNYAAPALAVVFAGLSAMQAVDAIGDVRRAAAAADAARASAPYSPKPPATAEPAPAAATPSPVAPGASVPPVAPTAVASPLARERQRAMERIAQARDHARGIARGTEDAAMSAWLRQTEAYLNALALRVRDAKDAETLAAVERDVEQHVLRHG